MTIYDRGYYMPSCDRCGHLLPGEKTREAARAAIIADGWVSKSHIDEHGVEVWEDVCRLCQREERGDFPWMK